MRRETLEKWIIKAESDLKIGRDEMMTENPATDAICFHMQQCVEKYLKVFLIFHDRELKRTHNETVAGVYSCPFWVRGYAPETPFFLFTRARLSFFFKIKRFFIMIGSIFILFFFFITFLRPLHIRAKVSTWQLFGDFGDYLAVMRDGAKRT